jgi:uncharacterized protein (UPF0333 family)
MVLFLIIAVIPVMTMTIKSNYIIANELQNRAENTLTLINNQRAETIDDYFINLKKNIEIVSGSPSLQKAFNERSIKEVDLAKKNNKKYL